jgi:hypothetical protein
MRAFETYMKFTNYDGSVEYVSVYVYHETHQDCYQGELDQVLYKQVSLGVFEPI